MAYFVDSDCRLVRIDIVKLAQSVLSRRLQLFKSDKVCSHVMLICSDGHSLNILTTERVLYDLSNPKSKLDLDLKFGKTDSWSMCRAGSLTVASCYYYSA